MKKEYIKIGTLLSIIIIVAVFFLSACSNTAVEKQDDISIVPRPQSYQMHDGFFKLNEKTAVCVEARNVEVFRVADLFCEQVRRATGFPLEVLSVSQNSTNAIIFTLCPPDSMASEAYYLTVDKSRIEITAATPTGLFYGVQSLLQLFPTEIFSDSPQKNISWKVPCISITDAPHFSYRGAHLDVARHFFSLDSVKRYIDHLARYKMNRFHWHLTDDQGWRIEIKQYPKLTQIGGCRKETLIGGYGAAHPRYDGTEYCGFYTQDEAREIVRYAAERFITVIPEIEMPGHARAALSAYPELSCNPDKKYEAATTWGVFEEVFCPSEATFTFLENVLTEIMEIFPSKYIHIGGDECPKKEWKESALCQSLIKKHRLKDEDGLQYYFIKRISEFLERNGRQIIGWDEILEGGLAAGATVMAWRSWIGTDSAKEAAEAGHDVIMTPTSHCYFDYYQADPKTEPLAIGGFLPLKKVYHLNPIPEGLSEDKRHHILGAQCNLWTEYIKTFRKVEYMLLPRLLAMSEVGWTNPAKKDWDDFCRRLPHQLQMLETLGVTPGTIFLEEQLNQ